MNDRQGILDRIRAALRTASPADRHEGASPGSRPGRSIPAGGALGGGDPSLSFRRWLPRGGDTFEERLALFQSNATELKAEFCLLADGELRSRMEALRESGGWTRIASHRGALSGEASAAAGVPVLFTDSGFVAKDLETCDAGVTECDALIAQTGSVLLTSRSAGGRALSVLPPHHIVIATRRQLLPDLPAAFELLKQNYAPDYPSFISFITGPSRTGDIERILVLGAHGPKRLTILCI